MTHSTVLKRIRAEYVEMPDMQLTLEQAQRLFGVERTGDRVMPSGSPCQRCPLKLKQAVVDGSQVWRITSWWQS